MYLPIFKTDNKRRTIRMVKRKFLNQWTSSKILLITELSVFIVFSAVNKKSRTYLT